MIWEDYPLFKWPAEINYIHFFHTLFISIIKCLIWRNRAFSNQKHSFIEQNCNMIWFQPLFWWNWNILVFNLNHEYDSDFIKFIYCLCAKSILELPAGKPSPNKLTGKSTMTKPCKLFLRLSRSPKKMSSWSTMGTKNRPISSSTRKFLTTSSTSRTIQKLLKTS